MTAPHQTLGTLLRHLAETLDSAVEQAYLDSGLDYRPRFTPVFRALIEHGPSSIRTLALNAGITHSATSQTVAEMVKRGWVRATRGTDGRQQIIALTDQAEKAIPILGRHWKASKMAASALDQELPFPLQDLLREAIVALRKKPFSERIAQANHELKVAR